VANLYKLDTISNGCQDLSTNFIYKTSRPVKGIHAFGIFVIVFMCELFCMWWTGRPVRLEMFHHILHSPTDKGNLELKILVRTEKLWESARTYIWRNLGQNKLRKPNEAKLSIVRIHVKN
jgi:hypothetical protein